MAKVFYIGDHPAVTTGFGTVAHYLTTGLHNLGWEVDVFGALAEAGTVPAGLYPFPVHEMPGGMPYGEQILGEAIRSFRPDVILINNEFQTTATYSGIARKSAESGVPLLAYRGIAVTEMPAQDVERLKLVDLNIAYTSFGSETMHRIAGLESEVVYHGVNHDLFSPLREDERKDVRRELGWNDRFIVLYVSRNRPNKKHYRVMKAMARLKRDGHTDICCHFHCRPVVDEVFELPDGREIPGGFNLPELAEKFGVADRVFFSPEVGDETRGVHQVFGRWDGMGFSEPDLTFRHLYGAADLYLHPSDLETFGLPLVEAMACGTPAAYPETCGVRREVCGEAGYAMPTTRVRAYPEGWDIQQLSTENITDTILHFHHLKHQSPDDYAAWIERGVQWVRQYDWNESVRRISDCLTRVLDQRSR